MPATTDGHRDGDGAETGSAVGDGRKRRFGRSEEDKKARAAAKDAQRALSANPRWFVPLMVGLFLVGLVWVVTYYLSAGLYPVRSWGNWNLAAGFAFIVAGFLMTTRWR